MFPRFSVRKHWKSTFTITPLSFDAFPGDPHEYLHKPYIARNPTADSMGLSSFKFSWWTLKTHIFRKGVHVMMWSFKVIQGRWFQYQSKVRRQLLISCQWQPCSYHIQHIPIHLNFGDVSLGCRAPRSEDPTLIILVITLEVTQPIWPQ